MDKILKGLLWGALICAVIIHFTKDCSTTKPLQKTYSDTTFVTIFDTVEVERVVARDSVVVRYEVAKLAVVGEDRSDRSDRNDRKDSISFSRGHENGNDSVEVVIPITQTHYQDSLYDMWVSGYRVSVDSMKLYVPKTCTVIETKTEVRYEKRKPWSLNVGVGYGMTGDGRMQPYVGVTVGWTIMRW